MDDAERLAGAVDVVLGRHGPGGPPLAEASATLGVSAGPFLVVCADPHPPGRLERAVRDELRARGGGCAWRLLADRHLGILWLGPGSEGAGVRRPLETAATARIGLSPVYHELSGTAEALRLAGLARDCQRPGSAVVRAFGDDPVRAVLLADRDLAHRAVRAVLGRVLDLDRETRGRLIETTRAFFESGGSLVRTAALLGCHRNTVANRLARMEGLTGRQLSVPAQLAELFFAIEASALSEPPRTG